MSAAWVVLFVVACVAGAAAEAISRAPAPPRRPAPGAPPVDVAELEQTDTGIQQRDELAADVEKFLANVFGWPG